MTPNDMSLEKYMLVLRNHARMIGGIFIFAIAIAGAITYITPKTYTATVLLNFDFKGANPVDNRGRSVLTEDTYIQTHVGIIKSQSVAQQVERSLSEYESGRLIDALQAENTIFDENIARIKGAIKRLFSGRPQRQQVSDQAGGYIESLDVSSAYSWLAQTISYRLSVDPRFNSRIVELSYTSTDPQIAAMMANRFAEAYIATNLQMVIEPARKTTAWFDAQLKSLRKKLEVAQAELTAYQQQEGIVSSDERLDTESSRLQDLSTRLVEAQQVTRNAVTEQRKLQEILSGGGSLMTIEAVSDNSVIQSIKGEIRTLEAGIAQMSSSLGKNHPRYKQMNSELQAAKGRLSREVKAITNGIDNNVALTQAREKDLETALADQKRLVLDLKAEHDNIAVLKRNVESAQATYNAALNEMNTTSMQSMIDQTNVSVIDPANVPRSHSSPQVTRNLILGAFSGLLLGIGLAIFLEIFVRRVHSRDDLVNEIGIPMLGHLKKVSQ